MTYRLYVDTFSENNNHNNVKKVIHTVGFSPVNNHVVKYAPALTEAPPTIKL